MIASATREVVETTDEDAESSPSDKPESEVAAEMDPFATEPGTARKLSFCKASDVRRGSEVEADMLLGVV